MEKKFASLIKSRDELLEKIREDKETISDFDIEREAYRYLGAENRAVFIQACKWYKEQLNSLKQNK